MGSSIDDRSCSGRNRTIKTYQSLGGFVLALLALVGVLVLSTGTQAYAETSSSQPAKYINIVYDDSGSMDTSDANYAWEKAHYAIEVFAAMLGPNDVMKVYTMSAAQNGESGPSLTIEGSQPIGERVNSAHDLFSAHEAWTDFNAAINAKNDLDLQPDGAKKYLVILTDGKFNVYGKKGFGKDDDTFARMNKDYSGTLEKVGNQADLDEQVHKYLAGCSDNGINVEYVDLGQDSGDRTASIEDLADQVFRINYRKNSNILEGIIEESNAVFNHATLPAEEYYNKETGELELPIPTKQIVVFVQGKNLPADVEGENLPIAIKSFQSPDGGEFTDEYAYPKYASQPHSEKGYEGETWDGTPDPENVRGCVAVFTPSDKRGFNAGTATVKIKNPEAIETIDFYYTPSIDIELTLTDEADFGKKLEPDASTPVTAGEYKVSHRLLNPFTGEEFDTSFIKLNSITTEVYQGTSGEGSRKEDILAEGESFTIGDDGSAAITCSALLDKPEVTVEDYYDIAVMPKDLEVAVVENPYGDEGHPVSVHDFDTTDPIVVKVTKNGEDLTEAQLEATTISMDVEGATTQGAKGIFADLFYMKKDLPYECKRGKEPSTFEISLQNFVDEKGKVQPTQTLDGKRDALFNATYDPGEGAGQMSYGSCPDTLHIKGASWLSKLLHWIWLHLIELIVTILILMAITWLLGAGRIRRRYRPSALVDGRMKSFDGHAARMLQPKPFRNKWEYKGTTPSRLRRQDPSGSTPDNITLHGLYWKFGREVEFVNYADWARAGWRISRTAEKKRKQDRARKKARKGKNVGIKIGRNTTMSRGACTIYFYDKKR